MGLLVELVENFNKLFPLYGLPFVPVGLEGYVKVSEKNGKGSVSSASSGSPSDFVCLVM